MEQRVIKFRVWDTYNLRMVESPFRFEPKFRPPDEDMRFNAPFIYYEDFRDYDDGIQRPCHVMQYTGLKDKSGKEIYENDIVTFLDEHWQVIYFDTYASFMLKKGNDLMNITTQEEIVGNIYQNPELVPHVI